MGILRRTRVAGYEPERRPGPGRSPDATWPAPAASRASGSLREEARQLARAYRRSGRRLDCVVEMYGGNDRFGFPKRKKIAEAWFLGDTGVTDYDSEGAGAPILAALDRKGRLYFNLHGVGARRDFFTSPEMTGTDFFAAALRSSAGHAPPVETFLSTLLRSARGG